MTRTYAQVSILENAVGLRLTVLQVTFENVVGLSFTVPKVQPNLVDDRGSS